MKTDEVDEEFIRNKYNLHKERKQVRQFVLTKEFTLPELFDDSEQEYPKSEFFAHLVMKFKKATGDIIKIDFRPDFDFNYEPILVIGKWVEIYEEDKEVIERLTQREKNANKANDKERSIN